MRKPAPAAPNDWPGFAPIDSAPRDGRAFLLGVIVTVDDARRASRMLELWHWCVHRQTFAGCISGVTLLQLVSPEQAPSFWWAPAPAPHLGLN